MLGNDACGAVLGRVNLDAHGIRAATSVVGGLIDAHGKTPRDRSDNIAARADGKRLGGVFVADAPNQRAPPRFIEWQDPKKVFEAPREAVRTIVVLRVDVAELAGGSDEHVLAGLNVDAGVDPGFFAGYLDFL